MIFALVWNTWNTYSPSRRQTPSDRQSTNLPTSTAASQPPPDHGRSGPSPAPLFTHPQAARGLEAGLVPARDTATPDFPATSKIFNSSCTLETRPHFRRLREDSPTASDQQQQQPRLCSTACLRRQPVPTLDRARVARGERVSRPPRLGLRPPALATT